MSEKSEEKIVLEREYTIPLRKVYFLQRTKRAPRAIRLIRKFIQRHLKVKEVKIDEKLNNYIWSRGIEKPPRRVRVRVVKTEDNIARVTLAGEEKG